jgi:hypothetical protein
MERKYLSLYCKIDSKNKKSLNAINTLLISYIEDVLEDDEECLSTRSEGDYTVFEVSDVYEGAESIPALAKSVSKHSLSKPIIKYYPDDESDAVFCVYFEEQFCFFQRFEGAFNFVEAGIIEETQNNHNNFKSSYVILSLSGDESSFNKLIGVLETFKKDKSLNASEMFKLIKPVMESNYESDHFGLDIGQSQWSGEFSPIFKSIDYLVANSGDIIIGFDVFNQSFNLEQPSNDEIKEIADDIKAFNLVLEDNESSIDKDELLIRAQSDYFGNKLTQCVETLMCDFLNIKNVEEVTFKFRSSLIGEGQEIFSVGGEDGVYITELGSLSLDNLSFLTNASESEDAQEPQGIFKILKPSIMNERWDIELVFDKTASLGENLFTIATDYLSPVEYAKSWLKSLKHLKQYGKTSFNFSAQSPEDLKDIDHEDTSFECFSIWKVGENTYKIQEDAISGYDIKEKIDQSALWLSMEPWPRKSGSEILSITEGDLDLFEEHLLHFIQYGEQIDVRKCWLYDVLYYHPDLSKPQGKAILEYFENGDFQKYISDEIYIDPYVAMYFAPQENLTHLEQRLEATWNWAIENSKHSENNFDLTNNSIEDRFNKVLGGLFFKYGEMYSSGFFADVFLYFYGKEYSPMCKSPVAIGPDKVQPTLTINPTSFGTQLAYGIRDYLFQRKPELLFDTQRYKYLIDYFISLLPFIDEVCYAPELENRKKRGNNSAYQNRIRGLLLPLYGYPTKYERKDGFLEPQVNDEKARDYLKSKIEGLTMPDSFLKLINLIKQKEGKLE